MKNYTELNKEKRSNAFTFDKYFFFVLFLIFFHLAANAIWIFLNTAPINWDPSIHIINTIHYADYFKSVFSGFDLIYFLKISDYYPPFVYLISVPFVFISNGNLKYIVFTHSIYFAAGLFFLYLYAYELFKNKMTAFFTTFLFSFFITINQSSREFMLDLPLTFLIIISLYFLEKTRSKYRPLNLYLFFVFFVFAQLTKWYAFVYISLPFSLFLYEVSIQKRNILKHLVICLVLFLLFVSPWYMANFDTLFLKSSRAWFGEVVVKPNYLSSDFIFSHLKLIIMFQTSFLGFIVFLFSGFVLVRSQNKKKWEILLILVFNYLFFTFIPNRNIRYLIPLMPFIAVLMSYGVSYSIHLKNLIIKISCIVFLIYFVASYFILVFGIPIKPKYKHAFNFPVLNWVDVFYLADYPVKLLYDTNRWPHNDILTDMNQLSNGANIYYFLCADKYYLNADFFSLLTLSRNLKNMRISSYYQFERLPEFLRDFDFVIIPKHNVIGEDKNYVSYKPLTTVQTYFLSGIARNFKLIKKYQLPGGTTSFAYDTLYLFKRKSARTRILLR